MKTTFNRIDENSSNDLTCIIHDLIEIIRFIQFTEKVSVKLYTKIDEDEIYSTVIEEFNKSKKHSATILLLTDDQSKLGITGTSEKLRKLKPLEKVTGIKIKGFKIPLKKSKISGQVINEGKTLHFKVTDSIRELFPRPLATLISKTMGYEEKMGIATPLTKHGKIIGNLTIISPFLVEHFIPLVKNLARHISTALELADERNELKKTVERLRDNEEKFKKMFENVHDIIAHLDKQGNIIDINKRVEDVFGYKREDVIGKNFVKLGILRVKDLSKFLKLFKDVVKGAEPQTTMELEVKDKNGNLIPIEVTTNLLKENGKIIGFVDILRDITERRQAEEIIKQQNIKLKKLDKIKSDFLNVTSHELRTPMSAIKGYVQMLSRQSLGELTEEQKKSLDVILRNANRLDNLIQDILDVSRLESGTMKFIPEKTNIQQMIDEILETMQPSADLKNIKINRDVEEKIPDLTIDQARIKQVIINLVNNAIKFSPERSTINIRAKKEKDHILFEVQDFGRGIPKNEQKKIFETFYQVDSGKNMKFGGTGLGLSISQGIVISHGGKIWVESAVGKGSTFRFTLSIKPVKDIEKRFKEIDMFGLESNK